MTAREFKPGTVAVATVRGVPNVRVMSVAYEGEWLSGTEVEGWHEHSRHDVADVRPLVVLDPLAWWPNETDRRRVIRNLREWGALFIADAIEAQTKPPKPPEPTGLGAVVEDARGNRFVRSGFGKYQWLLGTAGHNWDEVDAVHVLSLGVLP